MVKSAREIILDVLLDIDKKHAYSNISINHHLNSKIRKVDENFIREIVYGVQENKLYIDWIIKKTSKIKIKKISPVIKAILRMSVYQIMFTDKIPNSASVNEAVKLAKKFSHKGAYGYVNGVLRNICRNKEKYEIIQNKDMCEYLSIKYSHPKWLIKRWVKDFGKDFTEKLCIANNSISRMNIRTNTLQISRNELAKILKEKGYNVLNTKYAVDGLIIDKPFKITETKEFKKGYFIIQDESSMLVSQIMNPKPNSLVIDICCAPGGKTTHIAQIMQNTGKIIARDIYDHKLKLVQDNVERLGINIIDAQIFDGLNLDNKLNSKVDYCLVDSPCLGLGLIRRKPEIKWNRKSEDLKNIVRLQYNILENSSKYVKNGGILIYSTCSIEDEENIKLINKFLNNNSNFELEGFDELLCSLDNVETSKKGYIQLYPHIHGTDGFFIAKMKRKDR